MESGDKDMQRYAREDGGPRWTGHILINLNNAKEQNNLGAKTKDDTMHTR
jgi:hypothetical protein